jgi:flagellar basal body-associated protein FliL
MKKPGNNSVLMVIYRILLAVFIGIAVLWLGGTAWALFFRKAETPAISAGTALSGTSRVFTGMGRLRLPLAPPSTAMAIVSLTFPYDSADRAFSEELASRVPDLRNAAAEYFGSFAPEALQTRDEAAVKAELLSRLNALLRLGKIEVLYLDDYMIID